MKDRLWDTAKNSALTFTLANIPSEVYHVGKQYQNHIAPQDTSNSTAVQPPVDSDIIHTAQLWAEQFNDAFAKHLEEIQMVNADGTTSNLSGADATQQNPGKIYTADDTLNDHIQNVDEAVARKKGVGGAHNKKEFLKNDIQLVSSTPHPHIKGVEIIQYQMPKRDKTGAPIPGVYQTGRPKTKTVYDPNVISTAEYVQRGLEAANNGSKIYPNGILPREWSGYDNQGICWHGYYQDGRITSFYPE